MDWLVVALMAVALLCALVLVAVRRVRRRRIDFMLHDEGACLLLRPMNDAAVSWVDEHLGRDKGVGPAVMIDYRDADDIILGIRADGLTI